jgi:hypothetical protein
MRSSGAKSRVPTLDVGASGVTPSVLGLENATEASSEFGPTVAFLGAINDAKLCCIYHCSGKPDPHTPVPRGHWNLHVNDSVVKVLLGRGHTKPPHVLTLRWEPVTDTKVSEAQSRESEGSWVIDRGSYAHKDGHPSMEIRETTILRALQKIYRDKMGLGPSTALGLDGVEWIPGGATKTGKPDSTFFAKNRAVLAMYSEPLASGTQTLVITPAGFSLPHTLNMHVTTNFVGQGGPAKYLLGCHKPSGVWFLTDAWSSWARASLALDALLATTVPPQCIPG